MRAYKLFIYVRRSATGRNPHKIMLCFTGQDGHLPDRSIANKGFKSAYSYVLSRKLHPEERIQVDQSSRCLFHYYETKEDLVEDEERFPDHSIDFISQLMELEV